VKLKQLDLKQYCQHTDRVINFPVGVTGIVGHNGAGKSNILRGLRFALLGDSGNDGAKADDMNWFAPADAKGGTVKLKFECGGVDGEVSRAVTTARASMKHGATHEKSVKTVNPAMLNLLGLPKKTIQDVIFVMQGEIEHILFEEPAERKKKFQGLFGIEKAEPLRLVLQRELADIGEPPSDERLQELQKQLDMSVDPQLRQLRERQQQIEAELASCGEPDVLNAIIAARMSQIETALQLQSLVERAARIQVEINGKLESAAARPALDDSVEAIAQLQDVTEKLRTELSELNSKKSMATAIKSWEAERVRCEQLVAAPEPAQPTTPAAIEEARALVADVRDELAPKRAFVSAFDNSAGDTQCPTCGQLVPNAGDHAAQLKVEIAAMEAQVAEITTTIAESERTYQAYIRQYTQYESTKLHAESRLVELREQLLAAGDLESVRADEAKAAEVKAALEQAVGELQQLRARQVEDDAINMEMAKLRGQLDEVQARSSELDKARAEQPEISEEDAAAAEAALAKRTTLGQEKANIDGQLVQLQSSRATLVLEIDTLETQIEKSDGLRQYRQYCERARTLLHHDCLPLIVTQSYLTSLNAQVGEYLRTFSAPFSGRINDDLSIVCDFGDGIERPAARLSGGQKVALSVAFRFAVYSLFASDAGFMALDEPTAYLDEKHIAAVVALLQQVRQYVHSAGMQLIVVTHEPALIPTFDQTFDLDIS